MGSLPCQTGGMEKKAVPRCGTLPGYDAHLRRKEATCDACRAANAVAQREYRDNRAGARERSRYWKRTKTAAWQRLADEFPDRFQEILDEVRTAEPPPQLPAKSG